MNRTLFKAKWLISIAFVVLLMFCAAQPLPAEPLALHPGNPRYFQYNGKPTILVTSGEHYGAVLNGAFDYSLYLKTLAKDGLNLTRLFVGSYIEKQGAFGIENNTLAPAKKRLIAPWARSGTSGYIHGGYKFDLNRWNDAYFRRLHDFVRQAEALDVIIEVVFFSSTYTDNGWLYSPLHPDNNINQVDSIARQQVHTLNNGNLLVHQEKLVKKIVRELNPYPNVYYEIQNEPWADQGDSAGVVLTHLLNSDFATPGASWENKLVLASKASLAWQHHIVDLIVSVESQLPQKHLIAQNYCNFYYPLPKVHPDISVLNFHYAQPQAVTLNHHYNRPVSFDESGFAGQGPDAYRKQAWRFFMAGGAVFNGLDYSFYTGKEDGTGVIDSPGGGGPVLRKQLGILKKTMEQLDFTAMSPDSRTMIHTPGLFVHGLSDGDWNFLFYCEGHRVEDAIQLRLPWGKHQFTWMNPKTGEIISRFERGHDDKPVFIDVPEFQDDIVLKIKGVLFRGLTDSQ